MRQLCDAIDRLNDWVGRLAALLILPSLLITMIEVVARYAFNSPTVWVNESVQILFGFYFLLGGGYTLLHGGHVRVDLLLLGLKPRARRRADVIGLVVTIFYLAVLLWFTGDQALDDVFGEHATRRRLPLHAQTALALERVARAAYEPDDARRHRMHEVEREQVQRREDARADADAQRAHRIGRLGTRAGCNGGRQTHGVTPIAPVPFAMPSPSENMPRSSTPLAVNRACRTPRFSAL